MNEKTEALTLNMLVRLIAGELGGIVAREIQKALSHHQLNSPLPPNAISGLMTRKEVISYYKITLPTLYRWLKKGLLPEPIYKGGRVYFRRSEIEQCKTSYK